MCSSVSRARPSSRPPVAILCGGRGTRLQEDTQEIPKPLVEIGGMPIVWHVIQLYAVQGFRRFLLATGYKGELIERFAAAQQLAEGVSVECVDTGLETQTGGRIKRLAPLLAGERTFCATYADGVADIDLRVAARLPRRPRGRWRRMTVVRPELQFGVTELDGEGRVTGFREKPRSEHWINGGFFCFEAPRAGLHRSGGRACSSARRWSGWPPTASCGPTATRASGSAWTPTRTPSP